MKLNTIISAARTGAQNFGIGLGIVGSLDEFKGDHPYPLARALVAFGVYGAVGATVGGSLGGTVGLVKAIMNSKR